MKLPSRPRSCSGPGLAYPARFVLIALRRLIGWSIGHATPNKAPAVVRYPLHDLPASRVAPADMGAMGAAGVANANVVKIRLTDFGIRRIHRQRQRRAIAPPAAQIGGDEFAQGTMTAMD